ncbi:MAG: alanine dehydrogenase [Burkholderiales bacterium]|nr:alanine dehydrogenase [Burkholderiales bacterium]
MRIGVPREIKADEYRVGLTPESARALAARGHDVLVESGAGRGIGADDAAYAAAGATIAAAAADVWAAADLVVKVKEPQAEERRRMRASQTLFTYLHLAGDPAQARDLLACGATCIAYETVTDADGRLPLLAPMSEIAGRMSILVGAHHLQAPHGGRGVLIAGATGVAPAKVLVLGAGVAGANAARVAAGVGADVVVLDRSPAALARLPAVAGAAVRGSVATPELLAEHLRDADLVVGAVLVPGAAAPRLISRAMLATMRPGAVIVDIAIDQGGCCETSRPTTHHEPTFVVDGVIHYCVANMPGAVPRTSTFALNHATLPHVLALAEHGVAAALARDAHLRQGLNVHAGRLTHASVAAALGLPAVDPQAALG